MTTPAKSSEEVHACQLSAVSFKLSTSCTSQSGGSAGELWTDPETAEVMTTILADFYREALKSLEKQLNAGNADPSGQRKLLPNGRKDPVSASFPVLCPHADASDLLL